MTPKDWQSGFCAISVKPLLKQDRPYNNITLLLYNTSNSKFLSELCIPQPLSILYILKSDTEVTISDENDTLWFWFTSDELK